MPPKRYSSQTTIATVPRNTLALTHQKDIDAILKDLKVCSRHLKSALDSFKDELRTLERLYYKCKNQHRMALFFKRVSEMRRFGQRLSELDMLERVDLLRASFVGLAQTNDHKALRASWTHVPEKPHVCFLTERMTDCSALICKMRERLRKAYHHFTLAMQSGAFVQVILLFVAISSRMSVLSSQLGDALELGISTCKRLLDVIDPTSAHSRVPQQSPLKLETPSCMDHDMPLEDTGQPVSRPESFGTSTEDQSTKMEATLEIRVSPLPSQHREAGDNTMPVWAHEKTIAKQKPPSRKKSKKKKFDEIDKIFGF